MLRWDGQTAQFEKSGLTAPTVKLNLAGSGTGKIVGTYNAYLRYVDRLGFFSSLSTISDDLIAQGATGNITGATFAAPIVITAPGHPFATGDTAKVSDVGGNTSANGTWTVTVIDGSHFSLDGSSGNATYTGSGTWQSGISTVTYTNVQTPTDPQAVRRQILRNSDGEQITYYVDVDTTDLTSSTFSSTRDDTDLTAQESQAILDQDGLPLANLRVTAPSTKTTIASQLGRLFLAGQYDEDRGSIVVTNGSATVTGIGTDWVSTLAGRVLYVVGANNNYEIQSVDVNNQTLTLTESYTDASDNFALYAIRAQPAERKLVYYTPAAEPESWPPFQALSIQEDGDDITGLMARGSFLYVIEKRHTYKITFQDDPAKDGATFLSINRGCVNNRSWSIVDNDAYMLDEYGIHRFGADGESESVSEDIGEIFRPGTLYKFGINWRASRYFFSTVYRPQEVIRWFVALEGDYLPHHAICYNYRLKRWWLERYPFAVGGGVPGTINNIPYGFLNGEATKTYALWTNTTDIADGNAGSIRGSVTSAGVMGLTDSTALFSISGIGSVTNAPVVIIDGTGKGQVRRVVSATSTSLTVDMPWTESLDTTSVYQVGGVVWNWKSTWLRLSVADQVADRSIELLFLTTENPCTMNMRTRQDFQDPDIQRLSFTSKQGGYVRTDNGLPDKVIDLTKPSGLVLIRVPEHRERFTDGRRYFQIELDGATNQDLVALFEIIVEGMANVAIVSQQ